MKPKQQSEPPAIADGLTQQTTTSSLVGKSSDNEGNASHVQPPAAGGTDLATENAQLKAAIRLRDARDSVTAELRAAGARSPELLWDALAREIEFDGEGKPQNVAAAVAAIKAKYPEQFGTHVPQSIDGGAGQTDAPRLTRAALAKMKPAEIARLDWAEVKRVLAAG